MKLAAKNWLTNLDRPWLLLIDNADDPAISLEDYFPEGERGFVLVTTRNPSNKVHGTIGSRFYHFEKLQTDEASDLLLKAAGAVRPWDFSVRDSAARITETLGYLPLALIHAGGAIVNRLCSLGNYLNFYEKNWQRIRRTRGYRPDQDNNMNVYSSYEIIYRSLEENTTQEARDAVEVLKIFSFLHRENIRLVFLVGAAMNPRREREQQEKERSEKGNLQKLSKTKPWIQTLKELVFLVLEALQRDPSPPTLPAVLRDVGALVSSDDVDFRLRIALKQLT